MIYLQLDQKAARAKALVRSLGNGDRQTLKDKLRERILARKQGKDETKNVTLFGRPLISGQLGGGDSTESRFLGGFGGSSSQAGPPGADNPNLLDPPAVFWDHYANHFGESGKVEIADTLDEIYKFDNVGGPAVDTLTELALGGGYDLSKVKDPKINAIYEDQVNEVDIVSVGRTSCTDHLKDGNAVGYGIFNRKKGLYESYLQLSKRNIEIISDEFIGTLVKPVIKIRMETINALFGNSLPENKVLVNKLPVSLRRTLQAATSSYMLKDKSVLWFPREPSARMHLGLSWFSRLIVFYILEQFLIKGTLNAAIRRQRSTMAVEVGTETFFPETEDLDEIVDGLLETEDDPYGSIFAYPKQYGIVFNEIWGAKDFWTWMDDQEAVYGAKTNSLGLMSGVLTGESNFNNMEHGINLLLRKANNLRENFYKQYRQIFFVNVARAQGFVKRTEKELTHKIYRSVKDVRESDLIIPEVLWRVPLENYGIEGLLESLESIKEMTGGILQPTIEDIFRATGMMIPRSEEEWQEKIENDAKIKILITKAYNKHGLKTEEEF